MTAALQAARDRRIERERMEKALWTIESIARTLTVPEHVRDAILVTVATGLDLPSLAQIMAWADEDEARDA